MIIRVLAPALSHARPDLRLAGPARSFIGIKKAGLLALRHEVAVLRRANLRPLYRSKMSRLVWPASSRSRSGRPMVFVDHAAEYLPAMHWRVQPLTTNSSLSGGRCYRDLYGR